MGNAHSNPIHQCPKCLRKFDERHQLNQHLRATKHSAAIGDVGQRRILDSVGKVYAIAKRARVASLKELNALDPQDLSEGYRDGLAGEPQPGGNRGDGYFHGWCCGMIDKMRIDADDAHRALVKEFVAAMKAPT